MVSWPVMVFFWVCSASMSGTDFPFRCLHPTLRTLAPSHVWAGDGMASHQGRATIWQMTSPSAATTASSTVLVTEWKSRAWAVVVLYFGGGVDHLSSLKLLDQARATASGLAVCSFNLCLDVDAVVHHPFALSFCRRRRMWVRGHEVDA